MIVEYVKRVRHTRTVTSNTYYMTNTLVVTRSPSFFHHNLTLVLGNDDIIMFNNNFRFYKYSYACNRYMYVSIIYIRRTNVK